MKVHNSLSSMLVSLENIKNTSSKMVPSSAYCFHFAQFSIERTVYELCRTVPADPPVHCKIYRHLMSSTWKEYNTEDTHLRAPYGATKPWIYNSNKGKQGSRSKATAYFSACSVPIWLPFSDHRKLLYTSQNPRAILWVIGVCGFIQLYWSQSNHSSHSWLWHEYRASREIQYLVNRRQAYKLFNGNLEDFHLECADDQIVDVGT